MAEHGIEPVLLEMKEALAIVNGTATSCAVSALALHDVDGLTVLSQLLSAMSVEALRGSKESFQPLLSEVRPHCGLFEASRNIRDFLSGSRLTRDEDDEATTLRQDRYSIRTADQWIGPVLEHLSFAHTQLTIECNSITDNPIISPDAHAIHGGNFQARAAASAVDKTRQATFIIDRMLFAQAIELANPATSRGLPPNPFVDEPSVSFIMKAVDSQSAALVSGWGNQSLNFLAFVSAHYLQIAADILSILVASHLLAVCQALSRHEWPVLRTAGACCSKIC